MFDAIAANFSWSESGELARLHDRPWTSIKLAQVARKQNRKEVSFLPYILLRHFDSVMLGLTAVACVTPSYFNITALSSRWLWRRSII